MKINLKTYVRMDMTPLPEIRQNLSHIWFLEGRKTHLFQSVKTGKPSVFDCTVQQMQCSKWECEKLCFVRCSTVTDVLPSMAFGADRTCGSLHRETIIKSKMLIFSEKKSLQVLWLGPCFWYYHLTTAPYICYSGRGCAGCPKWGRPQGDLAK